jgi:hypothetical protein
MYKEGGSLGGRAGHGTRVEHGLAIPRRGVLLCRLEGLEVCCNTPIRASSQGWLCWIGGSLAGVSSCSLQGVHTLQERYDRGAILETKADWTC